LSGTEKLLEGVLAARSLVGKRITLCVSGSIAAYKAALLARLLVRAGATVEPVMTRSALRFLGRATLEGLTGRPVQSDLFHGPGEPHVEIARHSDLIAVVPATADLISDHGHPGVRALSGDDCAGDAPQHVGPPAGPGQRGAPA
jgi:phosphopantothenoylcysteine decarboxylase/phosphopantothenate--cysteine ligase